MANDLWRTPKEVFNRLDREFNFVADIAASEENALCEAFYDEETDSFSSNCSQPDTLTLLFSSYGTYLFTY